MVGLLQLRRWRRDCWIAASYLAHIVMRMMEGAGIHKTGSCRLVLHTMATHMLDNGTDTRLIQAMLGHTLQPSTQNYTVASVE
ncbi:tyrosine-type recombinase/integrase [Paraburkholderia sp. NPDC080076]|uniref:tyrosine-type recombinase/integrase n=1 Tax=Paraburkholderia sp. NPDC080076 TaxID=3390605 RepID=UPI003D07B10E